MPDQLRNLTRYAILVLAAAFTNAMPIARAADSVVTFTEIMFFPAENSPAGEWIELHNLMAVDVELSGWSLSGGIEYEFPQGTIINGGRFILVARDPDALRAVPAVNAVYGPFSGRLANEGEAIELRNLNGRLMDRIRYRSDNGWPSSPLGSGVSLEKIRATAASGDPGSWLGSVKVGGTPGQSRLADLDTAQPPVFSEVAGAGPDFWIELRNPGTSSLSLAQHILGLVGDSPREFTFPASEVLPVGGFRIVGANDSRFAPKPGDRIFLYSPDKSRVLDSCVVEEAPRARISKQGESWFTPTRPTPGSENEVSLVHDVVINEIMYHAPAINSSTSTNTPSAVDIPEEWIELYNRGSSEIDLSRWTLDGAVEYSIPSGTRLASGEYLVLSRTVGALGQKHPGIRILGGWTGSLSHRGDRIALTDAAGSPADEVTYYDRSPWPGQADGGGSSLELRNPYSDNSRPEAWAASNESTRSAWHTYTYTATSRADGGPTRWNEFVMGLLESGEALIDDISVIESPGAAGSRELIQNGGFEQGTSAWRMMGNHRRSEVIDDAANPGNHVLHLVATGPTEHMHNHLETTFAGNAAIRDGRAYQISFRAQWLGGSPRLNTRLYFSRAARTTMLETPRVFGTPGEQNSTYTTNLGPTFEKVRHEPLLPNANQPTAIYADIVDPDGVQTVQLWWNANASGWRNAPMTNPIGGHYKGEIPGLPAANVVQFYVEATDAKGGISTWPKRGRESRALFQVRDGLGNPADRLHRLRIIMTGADSSFQFAVTNVMSNESLGATIIYDEREVFYDAGVRLQSSERGRPEASRVGFTIEFPADRLFRGVHDSITLDRSGGWSGRGDRQDEIVARHIINQAGGLPDMYNDLVRGIFPRSLEGMRTGVAQLLMAKYNDNYLDGQYEGGGAAPEYKLELIYYPTTSVGGNPQQAKLPQPDDVIGTDIQNRGTDPEAYRWYFLLENGRNEDNYQPIIRLGQAMAAASSTLESATRDVMDVDQWARVFAFKTLLGDADTYGFGYPHNQMIYFRPSDGKALAFPWDMDFAWSMAPTASLTVGGNLGRVLGIAGNRRLYLGHILDLLDRSFNANYLTRWIAHYGGLAGQNYSGILDYIRQRAASARGQLPRSIPYKVVAPASSRSIAESPVVSVAGSAWLNVKFVEIRALESRIIPDWSSITNWRASVPLILGENPIEIVALSYRGQPLFTNSFTVTSTSSSGGKDSDGDHIPDAWERSMGLNPFETNGENDDDSDGYSNLAEFLAGTNPRNATDRLRLDVTRSGTEMVAIRFTARAGRRYRVLTRGMTGSAEWQEARHVQPSETDEEKVLDEPVSENSGGRLYRLEVVPE